MRRSVILALALSAGALTTAAAANPMDPALSRLSFYTQPNPGDPTHPTTVLQGGCGTSFTGMGSNAYSLCHADNELWGNLVNELGMALAPPLLAPPGTLGPDGLYVGLEQTVTGINRDREVTDADGNHGSYWHRGTEGTGTARYCADGSASCAATALANRSPDGALWASHFHVRKAFPFGFELGTNVTYLASTELVALGLDVRWALAEGYRHGVLGYLPDFAVRGAVNTLVGASSMNLTVVDVDATIGKTVTLGSEVPLTIFGGGQMLYIFGDSGVVDGTPDRSAYSECPTQRTVADIDPTTHQVTGSHLECSTVHTPAGVPPDLNDTHNNFTFQAVRIRRFRLDGGVRVRHDQLTLTGEFSYDVVNPEIVNSGADPNNAEAVANHTAVTLGSGTWQASLGVGLTF